MSEGYKVKFYKGDYGSRQAQANKDKAIVYVEHHFNGGSEKANYCLVNVATNAGSTSKKMAQTYVDKVSAKCGIPKANNDFAKHGVSVGGYKGRGNANLYSTVCPAMLLEPLFATNPNHAKLIKSDEGQNLLAECIAETIKEIFPKGGLIAFSVGHKYKTSSPADRGVPVHGGGTEADFAEKVLLKAQQLLEK